jgi:hypothetical protein
MFTYKLIEYMVDWYGAGTCTRVSMSKSAKKATRRLEGCSSRLDGVDGTPVMMREILMRGSKVVFDRWI